MASKDPQTMTVTIDPSPITTGGTVGAVVTVTGEPDDKVKGATARLVRSALRKTVETDVFWRGYHDEIRFHEDVIAEAPLSDASGRVGPGAHVVSLRVPDDALPTATGVVSWSVQAVIERHHGKDVKAEAPVEVLVGPQRFAEETTRDTDYDGERCLELETAGRSFRPGEVITGRIVVRPTRELTLTSLVAGLAKVVGSEGDGVVTQSLLSEPLSVQAGDEKEYPFALTVPEDAQPTVLGGTSTPPCASHLTWVMTAVAHLLKAPGETAPKPTAAFRVNVYNAGGPPADA